jgi:hypothetical protein
MDSRAVSAVIEKVVAIGLVVLFVSGFGTALFGGVVPDYRASAADELAERSLASIADSVEAAVPASRSTANVTRTVTVPSTIAGSTYRFELVGRRLHLRHPEPAIGATTRLAIPAGVDVGNTTVSAGALRVRVRGDERTRTLDLEGA